MANYYRDPTGGAAIGAVDKERIRMRQRSREIRRLRQQGMLTPDAELRARWEFRGISVRFLREALEYEP